MGFGVSKAILCMCYSLNRLQVVYRRDYARDTLRVTMRDARSLRLCSICVDAWADGCRILIDVIMYPAEPHQTQ